MGGLAIVLGLALTALLAQSATQVHPAFWAGLFLIALTGTLDDLFDLRPTIKFAAQIAAALLMIYWGGLTLLSLGDLVRDQTLVLGGDADLGFELGLAPQGFHDRRHFDGFRARAENDEDSLHRLRGRVAVRAWSSTGGL